jgi:hypothetical protein
MGIIHFDGWGYPPAIKHGLLKFPPFSSTIFPAVKNHTLGI